MGHGLFHNPGRFHHLGQKHLARSKQITHHVHAIHQRAFDHFNGKIGLQAGFFGVFDNVFGDALDQTMGQPFAHRGLAPRQVFNFFPALAAHVIGHFQQSVGGIIAPIKHHVFDAFAQIFWNIGIDGQLARIDDAHVHARLHRVIQKYRVHGFTNGVIAPERKGQVRYPARNMGMG